MHLKIRCLHPRCARALPFEADVPGQLASGLITAYHAKHEAHPLEVEAAGVVYRPGTDSGSSMPELAEFPAGLLLEVNRLVRTGDLGPAEALFGELLRVLRS